MSGKHALMSTVSGWQPIRTAPMDGTIILVYADDGVTAWNGINAALWNTEARDWRLANHQNLGGHISGQVTHWQPLPRDPFDRCVNEERNKRYPWTRSSYLVTPRHAVARRQKQAAR